MFIRFRDRRYYRARYYHPDLQRFISEDPIGLAAGDVNFYSYVGNHPLEMSDPLGLQPRPRLPIPSPSGTGETIGAIVGGTLGAGAGASMGSSVAAGRGMLVGAIVGGFIGAPTLGVRSGVVLTTRALVS